MQIHLQVNFVVVYDDILWKEEGEKVRKLMIEMLNISRKIMYAEMLCTKECYVVGKK